MNKLYEAPGYREYLLFWLEHQDVTHGLRSRLATAIGCQNSHLTRVLREDVHLTLDQAHLTCKFLKLNELESEYFMILAERDRASDPSYRNKLIQKLKFLKSQRENLASRMEKQTFGDSQKEAIYYSSWHWSAIHVATMVPHLQSTVELARRLNLEPEFVQRSLKTLSDFGLVVQNGNKWKATTQSFHLPKTSPMNSVQHGNWRNRAVLKTQDPDEDGVHYTVVQTISKNDFETIKTIMFDSIDRYRNVADVSPEEDVVCFTLDFFKI